MATLAASRNATWALLLAIVALQPVPVTCASPTPVAGWLKELTAVRYTSKTGASATLATAIEKFSNHDPSLANIPPKILLDAPHGLIDVCFEPTLPPNPECGFDIILRANDVAMPIGAIPKEIKDTTLGLTLTQLIAKFHTDANLAGKNMVTGAGGVVVLITATDEDPPPSRYDHGYQTYVFHEYFLSDGIVVAHAFKAAEN